MTKWRKRVGAERMEILLKETLSTAKRHRLSLFLRFRGEAMFQ